jgi:4-amino-4-deoxy-L-arabinose transferase-like glycosyltransferase
MSNLYLLAFFLTEMFYWKDSPERNRVKMLFLFLLLSQIFFIPSVNFTTHRFFIPFLPLIILFSAKSFLRLSGNLVEEVKVHLGRWAPFPVLFLFMIFFTLPTLSAMIHPNGPPVLSFKKTQLGFLISRVEANKLNDFLRKELKEDQIVWTDFPEILEWEGHRLCGWLPTRIETIYEIHKQIPVDAIFLTNVRTPSLEEQWDNLLFSERGLPKYREVKIYRGQMVFAKLLIRDERE